MADRLGTYTFDLSADTRGLQRGFNEADKNADKFQSSIDELTNSIGGKLANTVRNFAALAAGAFTIGGIISTISEVNRLSLEMGTLAERSGLAIETLGALTQSARELGGEFTEGEIFSAIERLQTETGDVFGLLDEFQQQIRDLDANAATRLGDSLGIDPAIVDVLYRANMGLDELTANYVKMGGLTRASYEDIKDLSRAWNELRLIWQSVFRDILVSVSPALKAVAAFFTETIAYLKEHKDFAIAAFALIAIAATAAGAAMLAPMLPLIGAIAGVTAVVLALSLAWEDLQVYLRGGDSVIGDLVERFPILGQVIDGVMATIDNLGGLFSELLTVFDDFSNSGFSGVFDRIGQAVKNFYASMGETFPMVDGFFNLMGQGVDIIMSFGAVIVKLSTTLWKFFAEFYEALFTFVYDPARGLQMLKDAFSHLFDGLGELWEDLKNFFNKIVDFGVEAVTKLVNFYIDAFKAIGDFIGGIFDRWRNFLGGDDTKTLTIDQNVVSSQGTLGALGGVATISGTASGIVGGANGQANSYANQQATNSAIVNNSQNNGDVNSGTVIVNNYGEKNNRANEIAEQAVRRSGRSTQRQTRSGLS